MSRYIFTIFNTPLIANSLHNSLLRHFEFLLYNFVHTFIQVPTCPVRKQAPGVASGRHFSLPDCFQ